MSSLNPRNDDIHEAMKARTNIKERELPDKAKNKKQFYFEKLEYARQFYPKWYKFLLQKYLKRLAS